MYFDHRTFHGTFSFITCTMRDVAILVYFISTGFDLFINCNREQCIVSRQGKIHHLRGTIVALKNITRNVFLLQGDTRSNVLSILFRLCRYGVTNSK